MSMIVSYTLALFVNSLVVLGMGIFMFTKKNYRGSTIIGLLMIALTIWAGAAALEMYTTGFYTKILFSKISYLGIVSVSPLFLLIALRFAQNEKLLEPQFQLIYWILPVFSLIMVWTNEQHNLVWPAFHKIPQADNWMLLIYDHGPVVYLIAGYSYLFLIAGAVILVSKAFRLPGIYRRQTIFFAISMILPFFGNVIYLFKLLPVDGYDWAPFFFTASLIVIFLSIFRYKFLDVLPIARDTLFRNLAESVVLVDTQNRIIDFNDAAEKFFHTQLTVGDTITDKFPDWDNLHRELDPDLGLTTEIVNTLGGQKRWWALNVTPIYDKRKILSGFILILQDINNRKTDEERIRASEAKLRELIAVKDTFFNILAHDLRNPFHAILGFSEMLHNDYNTLSDEERQKFISNIYQSAGNTYKLISNLLEWSRLQTGRISFEPEEIALQPLIQEEIELAGGTTSKKRIRIDLQSEPGLMVYADPNMLKTIIRNLVSNAMKFSYPGGIIQIMAKAATSKKVLISVHDKGVGMSVDQINSLFRLDRKISARGTENEEGTGIGLILTREFVEKNKGSLWVDSNPGFGTTFYFTLPTVSPSET